MSIIDNLNQLSDQLISTFNWEHQHQEGNKSNELNQLGKMITILDQEYSANSNFNDQFDRAMQALAKGQAQAYSLLGSGRLIRSELMRTPAGNSLHTEKLSKLDFQRTIQHKAQIEAMHKLKEFVPTHSDLIRAIQNDKRNSLQIFEGILSAMPTNIAKAIQALSDFTVEASTPASNFEL
jgi:hypothetical protein